MVNRPAMSKYNYKTNQDLTFSSESWFINADEHQGAWWPYWLTWLEGNSGELIKSLDYDSLKSIELAHGKYAHKRI